MNLIVSADKHWSIGKNGRPLVNIPAERQLLLKETAGKVVVMGRKTLETLPGGQPLGGRTNVVLSADPSFKARGAVVCRSMEETLAYLEEFDPKDIYILGGESIYRQFLPYCDTIHLTAIDYVMTQICVSLWIWIRLRTGNWQRRGKNRLILTSAILLAAM